MSDITKIYFDGACRGNGTEGAKCSFGIHVEGKDIPGVTSNLGILNVSTNNQAEFTACLKVFRMIPKDYEGVIEIYGDSNLVVSGVNKSMNIRNPELVSILKEIDELISQFHPNLKWTISHIPRHLNSIADLLANKALDN